MNANQRKRLKAIIDGLFEIREQIDQLQEEEQEKYDNAPESLQESERFQKIYEAADALLDASCNIEDVIESLNEI